MTIREMTYHLDDYFIITSRMEDLEQDLELEFLSKEEYVVLMAMGLQISLSALIQKLGHVSESRLRRVLSSLEEKGKIKKSCY